MQADIVCTNPPFSLFREFVAAMMKHGKKFLILGNINAVICRDMFPLIKEGRMWLGASIHSGGRRFRVPDSYPIDTTEAAVGQDGVKYIRVKGVRWFTNMDHPGKHVPLKLEKTYSPAAYPRYDGYDAINVDKVEDMPKDYEGEMGVPITFLDKHDPDQFEIIGLDRYVMGPGTHSDRLFTVNGRLLYRRIVVRRKKP